MDRSGESCKLLGERSRRQREGGEGRRDKYEAVPPPELKSKFQVRKMPPPPPPLISQIILFRLLFRRFFNVICLISCCFKQAPSKTMPYVSKRFSGPKSIIFSLLSKKRELLLCFFNRWSFHNWKAKAFEFERCAGLLLFWALLRLCNFKMPCTFVPRTCHEISSADPAHIFCIVSKTTVV